MSKALERLLRDVRHDWGAEEAARVDWKKVDQRLFSRIESEQRAERLSLVPARSTPWTVLAVAVAAAAAATLVVAKTHEPGSFDVQRVSAPEDAGSIVAIDGEGDVLVGGLPAAVGATLRLGDVIEARGAQVTLGRAGKMVLVVERGSSVTVTHVEGALILALTRGALEAQVAPVASGEALAVDVGPSRVAVHGTHLRVARAGERVFVDLNEGVVSVGAAPRVGETLGTMVAAPAHVEFSAADAQGTLRVVHEPLAIRAPSALNPSSQLKATSGGVAPPPAPRSEAHEVTPISQAGSSRGEPRVPANAPGLAPASPPADPNAQGAIAAAVRACMAERLHADDVTVLVSTTLYLQVLDDGSVRSARFDPPVAPDVNTCAARAIYRTRFTHGGAVTIPISVKN